MNKIYEFKGLSVRQKKELKKNYFKKEWKNILASYFFIILSSSKPFFSSKNVAIFVLIWYTLAILLSIYIYVNQSDYMNKKKKAKKYSKRHKNKKIEKGCNFFPEIGGLTVLSMQILVFSLSCIVILPVCLYLQIKDLETYKEVYMKFFVGFFVDTYVVTFFNMIVQLLVTFIYNCANDRITLKKILFTLKLKYVLLYVGATIILYKALIYYFNNEFEGLFGDMTRNILGSIYIIFLLFPLIVCILQLLNNKKKILNIIKNKKKVHI